MTTGDLGGNLNRLLQELRLVKFPLQVDDVGLRLGDPCASLRILHHALLDYSNEVAKLLLEKRYELRGKTDKKFIDLVFRLCRDVLDVKVVLTAQQMLQQGFAERKLLLLSEVLEKCRKLHDQLLRRRKLQALKTSRDSYLNRQQFTRRSSQLPRIEKACRDGDPFGALTNTYMNSTAPTEHACSVTESVKEVETVCGEEIDQSLSDVESCVLCEERNPHLTESLVAIRDPTHIRPQMQTKLVNYPEVDSVSLQNLSQQIAKSESTLDVRTQFQSFNEEVGDLRKMLETHLKLSHLQEPHLAEILHRIDCLESRVKSLETESHQSSSETKTREESLPVCEVEIRDFVKPKRSVGDIIAELTDRQTSAESFLKQCQN